VLHIIRFTGGSPTRIRGPHCNCDVNLFSATITIQLTRAKERYYLFPLQLIARVPRGHRCRPQTPK